MILKDNFYKIKRVEKSDNKFVINAEFLSNHPIYEGHFPEKPVVPGVCTLTVIKECLGEMLGRMITFSAIKECKYLSALLPDSDLNITITIELLDDAKIRAFVTDEDNQQAFLKLRATIK